MGPSTVVTLKHVFRTVIRGPSQALDASGFKPGLIVQFDSCNPDIMLGRSGLNAPTLRRVQCMTRRNAPAYPPKRLDQQAVAEPAVAHDERLLPELVHDRPNDAGPGQDHFGALGLQPTTLRRASTGIDRYISIWRSISDRCIVAP